MRSGGGGKPRQASAHCPTVVRHITLRTSGICTAGTCGQTMPASHKRGRLWLVARFDSEVPDLTIPLSDAEYLHCIYAAVMRISSSAGMNLNHATTYKRTIVVRMREELIGVMGEMGFAKWRKANMIPPLNTYHATPDVDGVEVRATSATDGCLILRDNDPPDRKYVLAIVDGTSVSLKGWFTGKDRGTQRSPRGHRPAWFIEQSRLRPMESLTKG